MKINGRYCTEKVLKDCGEIGGYCIEMIEGGGFILDDSIVFCGEDAKKLAKEIIMMVGISEINKVESE